MKQNINRCTYKCNVDFFKDIKTEKQAYILGLWFADGCVAKRLGITGISLKIEDLELLERLHSTFFENGDPDFKDHTINIYPTILGQAQAKFVICRRELVKDLVALGCVPNKSKHLKFPSWLTAENPLFPHFLRGYADGDGCLTYNHQKVTGTRNYNWHVISTVSFCKSLKKLLESVLEIHCCLQVTKGKTQYWARLYVNGNQQLKKLLPFLYKDSVWYMQRKYKKYLAWLEVVNNTPTMGQHKRKLTMEQAQEIRELSGSLTRAALARKFKMDWKSILAILQNRTYKIIPTLYDATCVTQPA